MQVLRPDFDRVDPSVAPDVECGDWKPGAIIGSMGPSDASTPIVCNPFALSDRARYRALCTLLKAAISDRCELPDGFAYTLNEERIGIAELGEWITLERQCCPFLNFGLSVSGHIHSWRLALTGPEGSKGLLEREFGSASLDGLE